MLKNRVGKPIKLHCPRRLVASTSVAIYSDSGVSIRYPVYLGFGRRIYLRGGVTFLPVWLIILIVTTLRVCVFCLFLVGERE